MLSLYRGKTITDSVRRREEFLKQKFPAVGGGHLSFPSPSSITNHSTTSLLSCKFFFLPRPLILVLIRSNAIAHYKCAFFFGLSIRPPFVFLSGLENYMVA